MISVSEARALVKKHALQQRRVTLALANAHNYVLADDHYAERHSPLFTNSAMDGVAVRAADCVAASPGKPVMLRLVGESAAGAAFGGTVREGEAVNVSTGALLPGGADAVIPFEEIEYGQDAAGESHIVGGTVRITKPCAPGAFVRKQGSEYAEGALVLAAGDGMSASRIALAAQDGMEKVSVIDCPYIAVFATGNEIYKRTTHTIPDTNTPMLRAAVHESGGVVCYTGQCADTVRAVRAALEQVPDSADVILTTGGVSVGEHDCVKEAAQALGFETVFWRVRQKPGKPLFFAVRGEQRFFGLPGNPVSALICYLEYVHPLLQAAQGRPFKRRVQRARVGEDLANRQERDEFLRVKLLFSDAENKKNDDKTEELPFAYALEKQDSFMLTSLTEADGFVFLESNAHIASGSVIEVVLLA